MNKKTLFELYALAVCFAAAIFMLVAAAVCLYGGLRAVSPQLTLPKYEYERSLSDAAFLRNWPSCGTDTRPDASAVPTLRQAALTEALAVERHEGRSTFVQSLFYLLSAGVAFGLHWRLARREQRNGTPS